MQNIAKCKNCKDIVESKHEHDFVACSCYAESQAKFQDWCNSHPEATHEERCDWNRKNSRGFFIDGGAYYIRRGGNLQDIEELEDDLNEK